jgi:hypothetical protein
MFIKIREILEQLTDYKLFENSVLFSSVGRRFLQQKLNFSYLKTAFNS